MHLSGWGTRGHRKDGNPHPEGPEDKGLSPGELLVGGDLGPSS